MVYKPIGAGNSFNREAEIEEIFASLGMGYSSSGGYKPIGSIGSSVTQVPRNLQPFMPETPQILKSKNENFFTQFMAGLKSPVTDTLSGFGVIKPRELPTGVAGILGNLAGSAVGWTALTLLTAGIGTKVGLVGAGAAKIAGASATVGRGLAIAAGGRAVAGGAIKGGLMSVGAGTAIAKGAIWGGLSQAHWAFGQQEYETVPKEFLIGALTGGVFGAAGHKITKAMDKSGLLGRNARGLLDDFAQKKIADGMIHIDDPLSYAKAINTSSVEAVNIKMILRNSYVDDIAVNNVKGFTDDIRNNLIGVSSKQKKSIFDTLDILDNAKFKSDIDTGIRRLNTQFRNLAKEAGRGKINPFGSITEEFKALQNGTKPVVFTTKLQATPEGLVEGLIPDGSKYGVGLKVVAKSKTEVDKYIKIIGNLDPTDLNLHTKLGKILGYSMDDTATFNHSLRQDKLNNALNNLKLERDGYITRAFDAEAGIRLASLKSVHSPQMLRGQLEKYKEDLPRNLENYQARYSDGRFKVREFVHYSKPIDEFLNKVAKDTGVVYRPNISAVKDSSFLYGKAAKFAPEWDELMKNFSGKDVTITPSGSIAFGVNSPIKDGDIAKYLKELKSLPADITTYGISLHDQYILQSPVGYLSTKLAPLRAIIGEDSFRMVRDASVQHTTYADSYHKQVKALATAHGWTSHKLRQQHGQEVGNLIEGIFSDKSAMGSRYKTAAKQMVAYRNNRTDENKIAMTKALMRDARLLSEDAQPILDAVEDVLKADSNMDELMRAVKKGRVLNDNGVARTLDDYIEYIAQDFIHNAKLKKVLAMNDSQVAALAKQMGTTSNHLKAAAEGRVLLDKLFLESEINPSMYRAAYLPHYRKLEGNNYKVALREFKDITHNDRTIQSVFWANELSRSGDMVTYDNNFFTAVNRYIVGMSKQKHFEPVFKIVNNNLKSSSVHSSRTQTWEQLKRTIQGIPTEMETGFDNAFHNFATFLGGAGDDVLNTKTIGAMLAELQYSAGMGFNPFMPVRNLTQKALALSSITESGNPLEGLYWMGKFKMAKAAKDPEALKWIKLNDILTNRVYMETIDIQGSGFIKVAQLLGMSDAAVARMDDVMVQKAMWMFKMSDLSNVEDTFGAKAMYLAKQGFNVADTIEMARSTTMATQFMYGIDSPMLYKNPFGKQIGLFQSWPLNWAQMLWEQGTQGNMRRAASTIVTMAVASELLSMSGLSFRSISPTATVQGILPVKMLEGERSWPLAMRVAVSTLDYMRGLADGDPDAVDTAMNNFLRHAEGLVPFGAVTNRTLKFIDRVRHDWVDYADTGFMHTNSLAPQTRENTSRLARILGETPEEGRAEAFRAWFGTTTKSVQRMEDAELVKSMSDSYARTRRIAIQAFIDGDYDHFQRMQESLVLNFGRWIEPKDIKQELQYMAMTARERQTRSLPADLEEAFYMDIADPRSINFIR